MRSAATARGALALALACLAGARAARADPPPRPVADAVRLTSAAAANTCVQHAALAADVARWLRRDAVDPGVAVLVDASDDPALPVTIAVRRDGALVAERRFDQLPTTCEARRAALALLVALAIDATLGEFAATGPLAPRTSTPTASSATPRRAVAPRPARASARAPTPPPRRAVFSVAAAVAGGAWLEILPGFAGAGYAGAELLVADWFLARLGAQVGAGSTATLGGGAADIALVAGRLDLCLARPVTARPVLTLAACAGVAAGQYRAQGRGFDTPLLAQLPWTALVARAAARIVLGGPVALTVAVDGVVPVVQPTITVLDADGATLHARSVAPIGGALEIGLAVAFR